MTAREPASAGTLKSLAEGTEFTCNPERSVDISRFDAGGYFGDMSFHKPEHQAELNAVLDRSLHWTLRRKGEPLCVFGATPLWAGVWTAFMLPSSRMEQWPLFSARAVKRVLREAAFEYECRRLQTTVDLKRQKALRFILHLGFSPECVLRAYGPDGSDHILCAALFRKGNGHDIS